MTLQITIIGLGQVGSSFGLALAPLKDKVFRCGHDADPARGKRLEKEGAFDKIFYHLPESVQDADVVLLALPVDQIEDTLKVIAEDLKTGAVVIDTSTAQAGVRTWAKRYLTAERQFISMTPVINAAYLDEKMDECMTGHADLFNSREMILTADSSTHSETIDLAVDLARVVGARVLFSDLLEADGIFAKIEVLPKLVSSALLMATIDQPGWKDARCFTSRSFLRSTEAVEYIDEKDQPAITAMLNQENTLLSLNAMISALGEIRDLVRENDQETLTRVLKNIGEARAEWLEQRRSGNWEERSGKTFPARASLFGSLLSNPMKGRKKK
ncbi:MAG: prephenate dehydrogenase/arogenate dehydrogenase family protein [Chloroflexi bacterium]|nr:prephenate dehydrogenase/arogenate dehydrogenase family protein [Chloroflexota bacterium]